MFILKSNLQLFSHSRLHMGFVYPNTFTITPGNGVTECWKATLWRDEAPS